MTYMNVDCDQLLSILSQEELDFVSDLRIPYIGGGGLWARKHSIDEKIRIALASGVIEEVEQEAISGNRPNFYVQSDYIPSGDVKSMADGKTYDSKSKYYKSLKEKGMVIVGDEKIRPQKPKEVNWHQAVADTINRME